MRWLRCIAFSLDRQIPCRLSLASSRRVKDTVMNGIEILFCLLMTYCSRSLTSWTVLPINYDYSSLFIKTMWCRHSKWMWQFENSQFPAHCEQCWCLRRSCAGLRSVELLHADRAAPDKPCLSPHISLGCAEHELVLSVPAHTKTHSLCHHYEPAFLLNQSMCSRLMVLSGCWPSWCARSLNSPSQQYELWERVCIVLQICTYSISLFSFSKWIMLPPCCLW